MEVRVETTYGAAKKFVAAGLEGFNREHLNGRTVKSFAITLRDGEATRGGLIAEGMGEWMCVTLLWIDEAFRRRGLGSALMTKAESEAQERKARGILVDTFSFQAPDFYRKLGYSSYGQVDDFPEAGVNWVRFEKRFESKDPLPSRPDGSGRSERLHRA